MNGPYSCWQGSSQGLKAKGSLGQGLELQGDRIRLASHKELPACQGEKGQDRDGSRKWEKATIVPRQEGLVAQPELLPQEAGKSGGKVRAQAAGSSSLRRDREQPQGPRFGARAQEAVAQTNQK